MKDFLGNEYGVGDKVLYAAASGRSITMIYGEVTEIYQVKRYDWKDDDLITKVKIQPLNSSRWVQHSGRTRYIDTRTGKGIDPFKGNDRHMVGNYYERQSDGKRVYHEDVTNYPEFPHFYGYWEWGEPDKTPKGWRFVKQEFKNYVKKVHEDPKPVVIEITKNIVKYTGPEVTEESHPEWKACKE